VRELELELERVLVPVQALVPVPVPAREPVQALEPVQAREPVRASELVQEQAPVPGQETARQPMAGTLTQFHRRIRLSPLHIAGPLKWLCRFCRPPLYAVPSVTPSSGSKHARAPPHAIL
jgi:hypothetical protein